jgi:signal peptidase I
MTALDGAETMYAFENTWHVIMLVGVIVAARVAVPRFASMRAHRAASLEFIDSALIAVLLVFCILRPFVIQAFFIPSGSMEPTLQEKDRILVNKFIYYFKEPQVGDIVVFDAPAAALSDGKKKDFIKRVVGVAGDRIAVKEHKLYRNGAAVEESYIKEAPLYDWPDGVYQGNEVTIPAGHLLVFGDNRNDSNDGHRWGILKADGTEEARPFLPRPNVLGKAMVIFWPPSRVKVLTRAHS